MMCKLHHRRNSFHATRIGPFLCWIVVLLFSSASSISQTPRPTRIAVLDLGSSPTGVRVAALLRGGFRSQTMTPSGVTNREFDVVDSDQAGAAALGAGFNGSLFIILSHGGMAPVEEAARLAAATVLSGPAGGISGCRRCAEEGQPVALERHYLL